MKQQFRSLIKGIRTAAAALIVSASAAFGATESTLPDGYIELEYIESNGKQVIDPGFMPTATTTFDIRFRPLTTSGSKAIFGTGYANNRFMLCTQGSRIRFFGSGADTFQENFNTTHDFHITCGLDGNVVTTDLTNNKRYTVNCNTRVVESSPFSLFTAGGSATSAGSNPCSIRLYSLSFADGETGDPIRNFIPCLQVTNNLISAGLYDTVTATFYPNLGSAPFTYPAPSASAKGAIAVCSDIAVGTLTVYTNSASDSLSGYNVYPIYADTQFQAHMEQSQVDTGSGVVHVLKGWELTVTSANGTVTTTTSTENDKQACYYTPAEGDTAILRYIWESQNAFTLTYDSNLLTITPTPQASYPSGTTITFTATAKDASAPFATWTGAAALLAKIDPTSPTITLTIDGPIALGALTAAKIAYVAHDSTAAAPDGASWATAYTTVQAAIDAVQETADSAVLIRVKSGSYPHTTSATLPATATISHIAIEGGYTGTDLNKSGETVLYRPSDDPYSTTITCIPLTFNCNSKITVALDTLVISNGYTQATGTPYGRGVRVLKNSYFTAKNCRFDRNGIYNASSDHTPYGGGLGIEGGSTVIDNCDFVENVIQNSSGNGVHARGAAMGMNTGTRALIRNSRFDHNHSATMHSRGQHAGGALCFQSVNEVIIEGCTFTSNYADRTIGSGASHWDDDKGPRGGAIAVYSGNITIRDTYFSGDWCAANRSGTTYKNIGYGGTIYLSGCQSLIERVIIQGAGVTPYTKDDFSSRYSSGSIDIDGGTLTLRNVLHANAYIGWALGNSSGTIYADNCTFAGARGLVGTTGKISDRFAPVGYAQAGVNARATFNNCIFAENVSGDYVIDEDTTLPTLNYCYTQNKHTGPGKGNIFGTTAADFADTTYYHPASRAGSYKGGYLTNGTYSADATTSPAVDGGDPATSTADEPQPNNYRINIGYDGGTAAASYADLSQKDPVPATTTLQVYSYPATSVTDKGATVKADISSLPADVETATITVAWGASKDSLDNTLTLGSYAKWQTASHTIANMAGNAKVYYQFTATANSETYTTDVRSFTIAVAPQLSYRAENPIYAVLRNTAKLAFSYRDSGGESVVQVILKQNDTEKVIILNNGLPLTVGDHIIDLDSLAAGTSYTLTLKATNGAGTTTLDALTFTTQSDQTPVNIYVAEEAAGKQDGTTPANAISIYDLNTVLPQFNTAGDEIRLLQGTYNPGEQIKVISLNGISIIGGYNADGEIVGTSTFSNDWTLVTTHRHIYGKSSNVTLKNLEFFGGYDKEYEGRKYGGGGVLFSECNTVLTNCTFNNNVNRSDNDKDYTGIGLGIYKGTVELYDSVFTNQVTAGSYNYKCIGNAFGADSATKVLIKDCTFANNKLSAKHDRAVHGAGVGLYKCTDATIQDCTFATNIIYMSQGYGAHIFISGTKLHVDNTTFQGGYSTCNMTSGTAGNGGAIYADAGSTLTVTRSRFLDGGYTPKTSDGAYKTGISSIDAYGTASSPTTVSLQNVLIRGVQRGHIFRNAGATYNVVNCTIAGCTNLTSTSGAKHVIYKQNNGTAVFKNNIIYGNSQNLYNTLDMVGDLPTFEYCTLQETVEGTGNTTDDPLFTDTTYYHVASTAGSYKGGYLTGGTFSPDTQTSPSIDAGNYRDDIGEETQPHNSHINQGYDGGTAAASRTELDDTDAFYNAAKLQILAYPPAEISDQGAKVKAHIASLGGSDKAIVTIEYRDAADADSTWQTVSLTGTYGEWETIEHTLTGITLSEVNYRLKAENSAGTDYSSPERYFKMAKKAEITHGTYPLTHVTRTSAKANLVLMPSEAAVTMWVEVYANGTKTASYSVNDGFEVDAGEITVSLTDLEPGTTYTYTAFAQNTVGITELKGTASFTTVGADAPMTLYVSTADIGSGDGTSAEHATADIEYLLPMLTKQGSELRFLEGVHSYGSDIILSSGDTTRPTLTISGGWKADGTQTGGETIISNDWQLAATHRIMTVENYTVTVTNLTIKDGNVKSTYYPPRASGIQFNSCNATVLDCYFTGNGIATGSSVNYGSDWVALGAVGLYQGNLTVENCTFTNNVSGRDSATNHGPFGGAVGVWTADKVVIRNTGFYNNHTHTYHARAFGGGALGLSDVTDALVENCDFDGNYGGCTGHLSGSGYGDNGNNGNYGGAIYIRYSDKVTLKDSTIKGSWVSSCQSTTPACGFGGTIYSYLSNLAMINCKVSEGGDTFYTSGNMRDFAIGSIDINGGTAVITNLLFADSLRGHAIGNNNAIVDVVNATIAGSEYDTASTASFVHKGVYIQNGANAKTTFRNCIIWDNAGDFLHKVDTDSTPMPTIVNCINQDGEDLENNIWCVNPNFADPDNGDYTLGRRSPAKNKGDITGFSRQGDTDLNGNKRVVGKSIDLGPYEDQRDPTMMILR